MISTRKVPVNTEFPTSYYGVCCRVGICKGCSLVRFKREECAGGFSYQCLSVGVKGKKENQGW